MRSAAFILVAILSLHVSAALGSGPVLPRELILEEGLIRLASMVDTNDTVNSWIEWLLVYRFKEQYDHDDYGWLSCILALEAVNCGNFGIGCILTDGNGDVVIQGHNKVFNPYFRSDRHGEMVVMDAFESTYPEITSMDGYTLFTSLESCPMCMARLITSGVDTILYLAPDSTGGMVHMIDNLPPVWIELASRQTWGAAECSPELISAADSIFLLNVADRNDLLEAR